MLTQKLIIAKYGKIISNRIIKQNILQKQLIIIKILKGKMQHIVIFILKIKRL